MGATMNEGQAQGVPECRNCTYLSFNHRKGRALWGTCEKGRWEMEKGGDWQFQAESVVKNTEEVIKSLGQDCDVYQEIPTQLLLERIKLVRAHWNSGSIPNLRSSFGDIVPFLNAEGDGWARPE